jgi:hypothetical protein
VISFTIDPWPNPWPNDLSSTSPITIGGVDYFMGGDATYISTNEGLPAQVWHIGLIVAEVKLYLTLAVANTVSVEIYDESALLVGGDVFVLGVGSHVLSCPIIGQTADMAQITLGIPLSDPGDILTNVEVIPGVPTISEFWTRFRQVV